MVHNNSLDFADALCDALGVGKLPRTEAHAEERKGLQEVRLLEWEYLWKTELVTLWLFNIAMENCPFIDGLPIKNGDFQWLC